MRIEGYLHLASFKIYFIGVLNSKSFTLRNILQEITVTVSKMWENDDDTQTPNEQNRDGQIIGLRWRRGERIAHGIPIRLGIYSNQIRSFLTDFLSIDRNSGYLGKFFFFFFTSPRCVLFTSAFFQPNPLFVLRKKKFYSFRGEKNGKTCRKSFFFCGSRIQKRENDNDDVTNE